MPHFAYIVRCADGTLYTGYAVDVDRRVAQHNAGRGASYTRGRRPVEVLHVECFATRSEALRREAQIKRWPRKRKEALALGGGA